MGDNSTVKITIDVVDANSGATVSKVTQNLDAIDKKAKSAGGGVQALAQRLREAGAAAAEAGDKGGKSLDKLGGHATTSLDSVRLLSQEFGIRLPRAMESALSRMPAVAAGLASITSGLLAIGALEVFARIGTEIYEAEQKYISITSSADKFYESLKKTSELDFTNTHSIETLQQRLDQSTQGMANNPKAAASMQRMSIGEMLSNPMMGIALMRGAKAVGDQGATDASRTVDLTKSKIETDHQQALSNIELAHALDGTLTKQQQVNAETAKAVALAKENRSYGVKMDKFYGNPAPADAGLTEEKTKTALAQASAQVKKQELSGAARLAQIKAENEERIVGLDGITLRLQKEKNSEREVTQEMLNQRDPGMAVLRIRQIRAESAAQEAAHLRQITDETARQTDETGAAGKTGAARVLADRDAALSGISRKEASEKDANGSEDPQLQAAFAQQRINVSAQADQKITEEREQFNQRLASMEQGHGDRTMSINARIDADTKRTTQEMYNAWKTAYGQLAALDPIRVQTLQATQDAMAKVDADGARQKAEARRQLLDETIKAEDQGAHYGLNREQEQTAAIINEYNERKRKLDELMVSDADHKALYARQEIAAEQEKNGKLLDLQREQAQKMEGLLKGLMSAHPLHALEDQGRELGAKYASQLITQNPLGRKVMGAPEKGTANMIPLPFGWGGKHPQSAEAGSAHAASSIATSNISAASTTLNAGSAIIHVGEATISGLGGNGGAAGAAVPMQAGASTSSGMRMAGPGAPSSGTAGFTSAVASTPSSQSSAAAPSSTAAMGGGFGTTGPLAPDAWTNADAVNPGKVGASATFATGTPDSMKVLGGANTAWSDANQLNDLGHTLKNAGSDASGSGDAGSSSSSSTASKGGLLNGAAGTAVGGGLAMFGAVESDGGFGGALSGAAAGAKLGSLAGPMGTLIGAGVGALVGALGIGGRQKAEDYDRKQIRPRLAADLLAFEMGSMPYQQAYDDIEQLDHDAEKTMAKMGPAALSFYNDHVKTEVHTALNKLTREQKAGRSQYGMSGAQYHSGGMIGDFGSMATSGDQGWIHAQRNEMVLNQQASLNHYQAAQLINGGATHSDMARYYGASPGGSTQPAQTPSDVALHFHAPDANSVYQLLMDNKHHIRAAVNQSYAENSGGADLA